MKFTDDEAKQAQDVFGPHGQPGVAISNLLLSTIVVAATGKHVSKNEMTSLLKDHINKTAKKVGGDRIVEPEATAHFIVDQVNEISKAIYDLSMTCFACLHGFNIMEFSGADNTEENYHKLMAAVATFLLNDKDMPASVGAFYTIDIIEALIGHIFAGLLNRVISGEMVPKGTDINDYSAMMLARFIEHFAWGVRIQGVITAIRGFETEMHEAMKNKELPPKDISKRYLSTPELSVNSDKIMDKLTELLQDARAKQEAKRNSNSVTTGDEVPATDTQPADAGVEDLDKHS